MEKKKTLTYRLLEMVPATLIWSTFILAIVFSFIAPIWVIVFIIIFDLYWLLRVLNFIFYANLSYYKYKKAIKQDWLEKVKDLKEKNWNDYYHIVYLPTAGEPVEVLRTTMNSLYNADYPSKKMMVVLGGEGRMADDFNPKAEIIKKEYGDKFHKLLITVHPGDLEGEMKGKGANAHWMGHRSKEMIDKLGIDYDRLIVSYFDSDTCVHKQYFSYLTYQYLTHPTPTKVSYQPTVLYSNNIWQAPAAMRVTAFGTVFWLLTELMRPERLYTFSSHSMSFRALVDVGFWEKDIVTDDSRIFLQCFFKYDGNYKVFPMNIPVSMDTVTDKNYIQSFKNLYKQQRRWAWGTEHFPYMVTEFKKHPKIPWYRRWKYTFNLAEGMYSWATSPILIFILGRLPLWVAGRGIQSNSVFVQNAPFVLEWLMTAAMIGIVVSAILSVRLLPPRPKGHSRWKYPVMFLQWIMLPVTLILFGSIPAIEAQTRLALGKKYHLGFFVTPKSR